MKCPTCDGKALPKSEKFYPFCSERCQLIDLGKWLDEEYRIGDSGAEGYGGGRSGSDPADQG